MAKNDIGKVLDQTFIDANAATAALAKTPTLVILDNLEALAPESLRALLDAAVPWSEAGGSRVLCTTRRPDFGHAAYRVEGTLEHRRIQLDGLGSKQAPDESLEWCAWLMQLPPAPIEAPPPRAALIDLFDRVRFHPLSIRVLTHQLKTRSITDLGERLAQLLSQGGKGAATSTVAADNSPAVLLASLELSLDKLDAAARQALPRLGVFQGGAFEDGLIAITGLGDSNADEREQLEGVLTAVDAGKAAEFFQAMGQPLPNEDQLRELVASLLPKLAELPAPAANIWPGLRRQLEAAALIEAEYVPGVSVPFLRFHPTLAPMLWAQLDPAERDRLGAAHRQRYYAVSGYLYREDGCHPHQTRAIAWRELPNLLHAVHAALDAGNQDAVDFADSLNRFLGSFGLMQEAEHLSARAQAAAGDVGSHGWFMAQSNRGEQLLAVGQVAEAAQVFQTILQQLGDVATYEQAVTLGRLGRCFYAGGRPDLAAQSARDAITVCDKLETSDSVKRHRGAMLIDLANTLKEHGKYGEARHAYQDGLKVSEALKDLHGQGVSLGQLGTLAMLEGNLAEAVDSHRAALALFQQLHEPAMEAVAWHQLGRVCWIAGRWDEADTHFRESARIQEARGNLAGAAISWNALAVISDESGKPHMAELWYRKAIEADRKMGNAKELAVALYNHANLLRNQPGRLAKARQLAEEALAINQTLDPGAAHIWMTYTILAEIATQEAQATTEGRLKAEILAQAREHRRLARETQRNFAGTRHQLRPHATLILGTVMAVQDRKQRNRLEQALPGLEQCGWKNLVAVICRILAGDRDADALCTDLDSDDLMIVGAILAGLADPTTLSDLHPSDEYSTTGEERD